MFTRSLALEFWIHSLLNVLSRTALTRDLSVIFKPKMYLVCLIRVKQVLVGVGVDT